MILYTFIYNSENSENTNRKRRLDTGTSTGKPENDLWNQTHVQLVRDLEKRGTIWRYSSKHLTLWTDEILKGNSSGANEEPEWSDHIEAVVVPPKSRRQSPPKEQKGNSTEPTSPSTLETLLALEAKKNETMQSAAMMMFMQLCSGTGTTGGFQVQY